MTRSCRFEEIGHSFFAPLGVQIPIYGIESMILGAFEDDIQRLPAMLLIQKSSELIAGCKSPPGLLERLSLSFSLLILY